MGIVLRDYQVDAVRAPLQYWDAGGVAPLVVMATGTGKSYVMAETARHINEMFPKLRAVILAPVRELVGQNYKAMCALWPGLNDDIGIVCAALGKKQWDKKIVIATPQSVWRHPRKLGIRHLILVDEAHLFPKRGRGKYYRLTVAGLIELCPNLRICGYTATGFRTESGHLCEGEDRIFEKVVYNYSLGDGVNDGWLAPLTSTPTATTIDTSRVKIRDGEFVAWHLENAANTDELVAGACREIMICGADRKHWLIFCCGVRHARHVAAMLESLGITVKVVTGQTKKREREGIVREFCNDDIRALVNVNCLTTGFDAPATDLIAMLRPTLSAGLYVQMLGRGSRKSEGKANCLVLDFAGNVTRHGPVDQVDGSTSRGSEHDEERGEVKQRQCPQCNEINSPTAELCKSCGKPLPREDPPVRHHVHAEQAPVMGSVVSDWLDVDDVGVSVHRKRNNPEAPPSMRVDYGVGLISHSEWISFESPNLYAIEMAERWWTAMGGHEPVPTTVADAVARAARGELNTVVAIQIVHEGRYWRVVNRWIRRPDGSEVEVNRYNRVVGQQQPARLPEPSLDDDCVPY